ncbi:MAG: hypothetical protein PHD48_12065 [Alphaproteobacteria bacterium]|nr:hypothetical protein [Alphaproteobacteria bacterium]
MSEPILLELKRSLVQAATDDKAQPPHARAFAAWIQIDNISQSPALGALAMDAAAANGPSRQTVHAVVLGYAANLDFTLITSFTEALTWLRARQYFVAGRPPSFEVDGLGLFGVAVGITCLAETERAPAQAWLEGLLKHSLKSQRPRDWNEALMAAALSILSPHTPDDLVSDDLRTALAAKNIMQTSEESRINAWKLISGLTVSMDGMTRAAAQSTALTFLLRAAPSLNFASASIDDVAEILKGIARSMRRWAWDPAPRSRNSVAAHWDIDNEYHVQDMLWTILAPIFSDLDDEEWLKSLGQHHPRADLAIPSLELIIEVKFIRSGGKSVYVDVIKEVAVDASTYLQDGSGYKHIIAFIWDDAARTENHAELCQGIERLRGVHAAIVLSRPSKMDRANDKPAENLFGVEEQDHVPS